MFRSRPYLLITTPSGHFQRQKINIQWRISFEGCKNDGGRLVTLHVLHGRLAGKARASNPANCPTIATTCAREGGARRVRCLGALCSESLLRPEAMRSTSLGAVSESGRNDSPADRTIQTCIENSCKQYNSWRCYVLQ